MDSEPRRATASCLARTMLGVLMACVGCGTTKWTDTGRSATEQLLITDAMDRAVSRLDFRALAGKTAYIDTTALKKITDWEYLASCIRQHMLASGCLVKDTREEADYIVEVRAGAVGTDRHDLLYGVPSVNVPTVFAAPGVPSQIPEIPIIKKTDQRGVVKVSLFAYNRKTGRPVWQSGAVPEESDARAIWVFGAGPFQRGKIYSGTSFAGRKIQIPLIDISKADPEGVSVADEAYFVEPKAPAVEVAEKPKPAENPQAAKPSGSAAASGVVATGHAGPPAPAASPKPAEAAPVADRPAENPPPAAASSPPGAGAQETSPKSDQTAPKSAATVQHDPVSRDPPGGSSPFDIQKLLADPSGPVTVRAVPQ